MAANSNLFDSLLVTTVLWENKTFWFKKNPLGILHVLMLVFALSKLYLLGNGLFADILVGTPEENLIELTLLPQIYGYSDSQIEVVFYTSTWILLF